MGPQQIHRVLINKYLLYEEKKSLTEVIFTSDFNNAPTLSTPNLLSKRLSAKL